MELGRSRVFLHKLADLERRVAGPLPNLPGTDDNVDTAAYELLMAAPLLRELLFGAPRPLVAEMHPRRRGLKLRFRVADDSEYEREMFAIIGEPLAYSRGDALDPEGALPGARIKEITIDELLQERLLRRRGEWLTVRDVIDYVANCAGAVHFGGVGRGKRQLVHEVSSEMNVGGYDAASQGMRAVGRIVVAGLAPLAASVRADAE